MKSRTAEKRQPPVSIPLTFEQAVGGLLAIDPKSLPKTAPKASETKKKPAKKPAAKRAKKT